MQLFKKLDKGDDFEYPADPGASKHVKIDGQTAARYENGSLVGTLKISGKAVVRKIKVSSND